MIAFRAAEVDDLNRLYAIALATGDHGADASHLYDDPKMLGHIYAAPYLKLSPELCFVAADDLGVAGYVVGALDTLSFERLLEDQWWPALRAAYEEPQHDAPADWSADQRRCFMIHHPERAPRALAKSHPAHLHMNLLPRIQGQGVGSKLLKLWFGKARELGATAVRVGANTQNAGAIGFWKNQGFKTLDGADDSPPSRHIWLGRGI
jgi:GNAT superfamily N-acetyltransferase